MGTNVAGGVEKAVETDQRGGAGRIGLRLLGPMAAVRDGAAVSLPASRKARALIAYLALSPRPVARAHLCELLWDVPDDPRGELRWCLSKIRGVLDAPGRPRVETQGDSVRLDLFDCFVDASEIARAAQEGFDRLDLERLRALAALYDGDFLDGLEIARSPAFYGWLVAQRRRFREARVALLEQIAARVGDGELFAILDQWLELSPFDRQAHVLLLQALARHGRLREAEEHLAATARLYEAEGLDAAEIHGFWRAARAQAQVSSHAEAAALSPLAGGAPAMPDLAAPRRASVAVTPFFVAEAETSGHSAADGLVHDVITRLAKLRSLFVIAQGTVFALNERGVGPDEAGRRLGVDYVVSGRLAGRGGRLSLTVELAETRSARIIWTEVFDAKRGDALVVLDEIGDRIVASIASEIETIERNRALLKPPNSLDAWEALHRGLWHMYRFNRADNDQAQHFFERATRLDPTFARAYAGLSFTHFQRAFQGWAPLEAESALAYEAAGQSLMADESDPSAHWAMGRALWLRDRNDQSVAELERAVDLSPNFALGHYTLAFVHAQAGDPTAAVDYSEHARRLSPFDPLLFGMLGARAMALVRLGRYEEAADCAVKAAARPNAHAHIVAIAAYCLALAGRPEEGRVCLAKVRLTLPGYGADEFLARFRFPPEAQALFRKAAKSLG